VVVRRGAAGAAGGGWRLVGERWRLGRTAAAALAAQEAHVLRDDLGDVALVAVLVVVVARADRALDEDLPALTQVLAAVLALLSPDDDVVPLGTLLALALGVVPHLAGGEGKLAHRPAGAGEADLGIFSEVADEDDLVDRHVAPPGGSVPLPA